MPKLDRGFITDGGGQGAIIIFNLKTYEMPGRIQTVRASDGIIYDEAINRVIAVSGDGNSAMAFNPDIDAKTGHIDQINQASLG